MITNISQENIKGSGMDKPSDYRLNEAGQFQIDQFDKKPAFASFLPGIGGPDGVPLWCLYVNRAQAISSFGVSNKDNAIVEFLPANWAYQLVGVQGFRTFCMIDGQYYEPFQNDVASQVFTSARTLWVEMDRLKIREDNQTLGLRFEVCYFSPVNRPIGSLVRLLTITNTSSAPRRIHALDGLPLIIPAGFSDFGIKAMRRIHEAYASVRIAAPHVPFYAAKVMTHDEAEVEEVRKGNFYAAWLSDGDALLPVEPIYDPDLIFGAGQDLVTPRLFIQNQKLNRAAQVAENKLPCAMVPFDLTLPAGDAITLAAVIGMAPNESMLTPFLAEFRSISAFEQASQQSRRLIRALTQPAFSVSSKPQLDAYARQNFLDNVLRGGVPKAMPSASGETLIHLYARRHGDAERDYNFFDLPADPLSSGEGNYRDICQNRRSDILFYPETADHEIRMFVSLLQPDGYNPLSIKGYKWRLCSRIDPVTLCPSDDAEARAAFARLITHDFSPGQLLSWADQHRVEIKDRVFWLDSVLKICHTSLVASGHAGGYWIDHWTYIADLLEAYQSVYPDRVKDLLTAQADIPWHCEPACVQPRSQKYLRRGNGPLQLQAVAESGVCQVELPPVTVFGKLCALLAVKAVSLDYEGRGIEMEAGRPGWNDALNGLPGLFGSSTCETAEAIRLANWLLEALPQLPDTALPVEAAVLIQNVIEDLQQKYDWDRAAGIREAFRDKIYHGTSTDTVVVSGPMLEQLLRGVIARFENGLEQAIDPQTGLLHTYFLHKPQDIKNVGPRSAAKTTHVQIQRFAAEPLPLFLEGQVHWLRVCSPSRAKHIYQSVRQSPLVDKPLAMYKLNECLRECSPEIGRARTFSRGWFENESIWLHMSSKYLLELLKNGLHGEFFSDAQTMLVPFMDPAVYGRSILENSSFIASSDCPDPQARGRGFVARLSGTTAEFIHIWQLLTVGARPFAMRDGQLTFSLTPILPGDWFTPRAVTARWNEKDIDVPANAFACALLGDILLVYHNPAMRDTYGDPAIAPVKYVLDNAQTVNASELTGENALRIRQKSVKRLDVWLK
ncbi:MAG: hypothetical protein LLF76_10695 [Planctomycetaceae bacterium]|nr:hypothetical protein [Planctomycetaceae bacterium]